VGGEEVVERKSIRAVAAEDAPLPYRGGDAVRIIDHLPFSTIRHDKISYCG
jgi:hypothetical protein